MLSLLAAASPAAVPISSSLTIHTTSRMRAVRNNSNARSNCSTLVQFPYGDFTDQVDATTQYLDYMAGKPRLIMPPPRALGVAINSHGQLIGQVLADCRGAVLIRGRRSW